MLSSTYLSHKSGIIMFEVKKKMSKTDLEIDMNGTQSERYFRTVNSL